MNLGSLPWARIGPIVVAFALLAALTPAAPARSAIEAFRVVKTVVLGGEGGWDYLTYDAADKRLFVSRGTHVAVLDPNGAVVGDIPGTLGVHGIALAPELGKGFTSNGRSNNVTVFDLKSLKTLGTIAIDGTNPDAILYDPATKHVYTFNGGSSDATAIDAESDTVIGTIALPGKPEFAATENNGTIFVNIEDKSELVSIDANANKIANTWPLAPCESPSGLSIDAANHRLFAGCHNNVMAVVNADTGGVITTLPIGSGVDATAFDPSLKLAFSSNGDGTLTVVHEDSADHYTRIQDVTTEKGARTMALDPNTNTVYLVTAKIEQGPPLPGETRPSRIIVPGTFALLVVHRS